MLHAVLGTEAIIAGRLASEPGVYGGYLATSVVLLPAVAAGAGDRRSRWDGLILATACTAGVLGVGALSLAVPSAFSDESVWSAFGAGYGFVPLLLPPLGLWWLFSAHVRTVPAP